jgi:hypothetical protein
MLFESGSVRRTIADETFDLDTGDPLYFAADVTQRYANISDAPWTYYVAALIMRPRGPA